MTIKPSADVYSTSSDNTNWIIHTNVQTTFTFSAPSGIITNVRFRNGNADVNPSSRSGAGTLEYKVTLDGSVTFTGFEVTFFATSGSCGTNATWELTTDDSNRYTVLTISGSGAMNNYGHTTVDDIWRTDAPWGYDLRSVTIGNDITTIGNYAFIGCQQLSSLTIGSSVTSIGTNAIDHCDGLTEVTLPASVSTIGNGAFKNCVGLTRVNIERTDDPIVTLGSSCFNGCNNLQYIVAPTPALALQYKDATNWSASAGKLRVALGDYLFTATDEGGTAAYAITNETDLRNLSAAVIAGNTASGYTFRQTANITLGNTGFRPIGKNDDICFSGTYDGGDYTISGLHVIKIDGFYYYGLFGRVKNGTVKNVRLISPSVNVGNVDLRYCYGALVGIAKHSTVKDCVIITPTIEGSSGMKGAIIGNFDNPTNLQNLYFYDGNCNNPIGLDKTISTVCRARKVTLGSGIGSVSPDANSMDNGFVYNNERYYREKLTLTLTTNLIENTGYHIVYKVNGKILDGNTYTVNSTDGDVTLTAEYTPDIPYIDADYIQACLGADNDGSAEHPYTISDADGWNAFCDALQDNTTWNRFSGKTVKLGNSISVTRVAGSDGHDFCGTFDGQGHTLTVSYVNTDNNTMTAPFSYVDGATIRNLVVGGSITGSAHRAAGIIGETSDNLSHITNCVSSVNISGGRYTAGFSVGGNVAIEGCVFNGKIVGTQYSGGFVGWSYSGLAITNCLFAPQDGSSISGGTFYYNGGGGDITPTNSYYTIALGTAQGTAPYIYTSKPESIGTEGTTYSVSGITPYTDGLGYGGKYYMAEAATFNLTANLAGGAYWSTFYSNACNYQAPDGTQVFAVKLTGTTLTMTEIEDRIVKSGEGVVLKNSTTGSIEMTQTENTPTGNFDGNSLKGTMKAITNPGNAYVLNTGSGGVGFYKLNASGTIGAHKAYLTSSALAREFFGFDEEATGIASMADGGSMKSDVWHTLDGRRLSGKPTTKGVFIHNGRKEVLK